MFRPFDDYVTHLDIIGIYHLDVAYRRRVRELAASPRPQTPQKRVPFR